jgi:hypothetical protein
LPVASTLNVFSTTFSPFRSSCRVTVWAGWPNSVLRVTTADCRMVEASFEMVTVKNPPDTSTDPRMASSELSLSPAVTLLPNPLPTSTRRYDCEPRTSTKSSPSPVRTVVPRPPATSGMVPSTFTMSVAWLVVRVRVLRLRWLTPARSTRRTTSPATT